MVLDGLAHGLILLGTERHGGGLARDFPGPLVAGARGPEGGAIQDGAPADVTHARQAAAETLIFTPQGFRRVFFPVHGGILVWRSSLGKYIYFSMQDTPFFPDWRRRLGPMGQRVR